MATRIQNIVVLLLLLFVQVAPAQDNAPILTELNRDIWKPFIEGVNTNNPELYNGVNAPEFYWVQDGIKPRIMNLAEYIEDARIVMKSRAAKNMGTSLEVRFMQRNVTSEFASERCIIKYTSTAPNNESEIFYGSAHVFSRKVNGVWKKIVQHVSTESVTQEQFEKAQPMG